MQDRWSAERAKAWWAECGWICGINFLPSSAVNFLEMWMADTFDRETIRRELRWASEAGFNAVRTNPHFLIWKHDRDGLLERMAWFLKTAGQFNLKTVFVPFDDCGFGGDEPEYGPQPEPLTGVHNGRAVASPGRAAVMDHDQWPDFERYIKDVVGAFRSDPGILMWDIYNEPGNLMIFTRRGFEEYDPALIGFSRELLRASFDWTRSVDPVQPVTVGAWRTPPKGRKIAPFDNEIDQLALGLSDVVTFHAYCDRAHAETFIDYLEGFDRPILSTEWMARTIDSRIDDQLKVYKNRNVGCFSWGLVRGRTQTHLSWPIELAAQHGPVRAPEAWFHDMFWPDGTPYDEAEIALIQTLTGKRQA